MPEHREIEESGLLRAVATDLQRNALTICTAESCTAGGLGWALTIYPGSSAWFRGGILAYANDIKRDVLHVPVELLDTYGAVSEQVAQAMAEQVRVILAADIGVAITGIAGPSGGTPDKPVGTVWFAVATEETCKTRRGAFPGTRKAVRQQAVRQALGFVKEVIIDYNIG
jgi:PncC family amidohydrolase